jgi:hypothetical protein
MKGLVNAQGVLESVFPAAQLASENTTGKTVVDVPEGFPETKAWNGTAFVDKAPPAPRLMNWQIIALFTTAEKLLIYGSDVAEVRALVAELLVMPTPLALDSSYHVQGTALLLGLELITAPRAAMILAGQPPA